MVKSKATGMIKIPSLKESGLSLLFKRKIKKPKLRISGFFHLRTRAMREFFLRCVRNHQKYANLLLYRLDLNVSLNCMYKALVFLEKMTGHKLGSKRCLKTTLSYFLFKLIQENDYDSGPIKLRCLVYFSFQSNFSET